MDRLIFDLRTLELSNNEIIEEKVVCIKNSAAKNVFYKNLLSIDLLIIFSAPSSRSCRSSVVVAE